MPTGHHSDRLVDFREELGVTVKLETQRELVDEINKKTIQGALTWEMVPGDLRDSPHPEYEINYYYCAYLDDTSLFMYEVLRPKPASPYAWQLASMIKPFSPEVFLVARDGEGTDKLILKGRRLLGDLLQSVRAKAGTPESVAQDLLGKLRGL